MYLVKFRYFLLAAMLITSAATNAETRYFFAVESVNSDTELNYDNVKEIYEHSGNRVKIGAEFEEGGILGFEFLSGDEDETVDPFGTPFELKTDSSIGIFAHIGRPFYFRLAYSMWNAEYTDLINTVTDIEDVSSIEYGFGYQLWIGNNLALYADYSFRHTDVRFPLQFVGESLIEYESELVSVGISTTF